VTAGVAAALFPGRPSGTARGWRAGPATTVGAPTAAAAVARVKKSDECGRAALRGVRQGRTSGGGAGRAVAVRLTVGESTRHAARGPSMHPSRIMSEEGRGTDRTFTLFGRVDTSCFSCRHRSSGCRVRGCHVNRVVWLTETRPTLASSIVEQNHVSSIHSVLNSFRAQKHI